MTKGINKMDVETRQNSIFMMIIIFKTKSQLFFCSNNPDKNQLKTRAEDYTNDCGMSDFVIQINDQKR